MGIETCPPDVEESTEPPLPSCSDEGHQGLPGSTLDHSAVTRRRRLDEGEKVLVTPDKVLKDQKAVATLSDHHREWEAQHPYAHTWPISELSHTLGVDLR